MRLATLKNLIFVFSVFDFLARNAKPKNLLLDPGKEVYH